MATHNYNNRDEWSDAWIEPERGFCWVGEVYLGLALFTVYPELEGPVPSSGSVTTLIIVREQVSILAQGLPEVSGHQSPSPLPIDIYPYPCVVDQVRRVQARAFAHLATGYTGVKACPLLHVNGGRGVSFLAALCLMPTVVFPQRQAVPVTPAN